MPCDTITTQTLAAGLTKAVPAVLLAAINSLNRANAAQEGTTIRARVAGHNVDWNAQAGLTVTGWNSEQVAKDIKMAYSKQAVSWAAQRAGWKVISQDGNTVKVSK